MNNDKITKHEFNITDEQVRELEEINNNPDLEEQGYKSAPLIMRIAGVNIEELLLSMLVAGKGLVMTPNARREIGVVRWCLDNRKSEKS